MEVHNQLFKLQLSQNNTHEMPLSLEKPSLRENRNQVTRLNTNCEVCTHPQLKSTLRKLLELP